MIDLICPDCGEELDFLDTIVNKATGLIMYYLYICHNEDCDTYGRIYNDQDGRLITADPSGCY